MNLSTVTKFLVTNLGADWYEQFKVQIDSGFERHREQRAKVWEAMPEVRSIADEVITVLPLLSCRYGVVVHVSDTRTRCDE